MCTLVPSPVLNFGTENRTEKKLAGKINRRRAKTVMEKRAFPVFARRQFIFPANFLFARVTDQAGKEGLLVVYNLIPFGGT